MTKEDPAKTGHLTSNGQIMNRMADDAATRFATKVRNAQQRGRKRDERITEPVFQGWGKPKKGSK